MANEGTPGSDPEHPLPEAADLGKERAAIAKMVLAELPERDRTALIRFYVHGHDSREICRDLGLTEDQFHAIKARVKRRFTELRKQGLGQK